MSHTEIMFPPQLIGAPACPSTINRIPKKDISINILLDFITFPL